MDRNEVTQSPILPGTRWGGTRTEETEVEAIITEGKKVCIRWTVNSRRKRRNTERPLEGFRENDENYAGKYMGRIFFRFVGDKSHWQQK